MGTIKNSMFDEDYQANILKELNLLGELGWELVSTIPINAGYGWTNLIMLILKRKVEEVN